VGRLIGVMGTWFANESDDDLDSLAEWQAPASVALGLREGKKERRNSSRPDQGATPRGIDGVKLLEPTRLSISTDSTFFEDDRSVDARARASEMDRKHEGMEGMNRAGSSARRRRFPSDGADPSRSRTGALPRRAVPEVPRVVSRQSSLRQID
jgi:hypothetical protein